MISVDYKKKTFGSIWLPRIFYNKLSVIIYKVTNNTNNNRNNNVARIIKSDNLIFDNVSPFGTIYNDTFGHVKTKLSNLMHFSQLKVFWQLYFILISVKETNNFN